MPCPKNMFQAPGDEHVQTRESGETPHPCFQSPFNRRVTLLLYA